VAMDAPVIERLSMSYEPMHPLGKVRGLLLLYLTQPGEPGFQANQKSVNVTKLSSPLVLFQPIRAKLARSLAVNPDNGDRVTSYMNS